jgi:hypothetical protein
LRKGDNASKVSYLYHWQLAIFISFDIVDQEAKGVGSPLCTSKVSQVLLIGRTSTSYKHILLGRRHTPFISQHKEREDQDMLVPAVERNSRNQAACVAHGCTTGAWRFVHQPVSFQETQSTGHPSMALN